MYSLASVMWNRRSKWNSNDLAQTLDLNCRLICVQLILCEVPLRASSKVSYIYFKRLPLFSLQDHFLRALLMPPEKEFSAQGK